MELPNRDRWGKWLLGSLAALLLLAALAACSSSSNDDSAASMADGAEPASAGFGESLALGSGESGSEDRTAQDASGSAESAPSASSAAQGADTAAGTGSGIGAIADANAGYNRKMIYSATVVLKAESFDKAEEKVSNAIFQSQGFIVQFSDTNNGDEIGSTYVIKVPSANFSSFLALLKAIPNEGFDRQIQGSDVTEEYVDLEGRLTAKQAEEARMLAFMDKAASTDDLVAFSNALGSVQQEIEKIKGRMRYLDQNVAYSTINLRLYEISERETAKAEENAGLGAKLGDALVGTTRLLGRIGEGLLTFAAGLLPVLLVAAVIGVPAYWWTRKARAAQRIRAAARRKELNAAASDPAAAVPPASLGAAAEEEERPVD
ncbi:DUF4349 domain-containing protein [Cohnella lubricantis]|uniref:DUF4349 domain-containing protein n=1 Tax=Cohnella lubricantis TaxID=2163172 RepID=A0A841TDL9_9BACL|nr:DUF4349 domain-containing protein [Cohnella lubricantis]MBB6677330.1 DUF4349 domain-containing protein [Cohnella lubricantis]MBP2116858.1 hypothetical protein [Cohnella lubricantis]